MTFRRLGQIEFIAGDLKPDRETIVLFHGYGADANDLASLEPFAKQRLKKSFNWVFPQGIETVDLGFGMKGRAWFPLRIADFESSARAGHFQDHLDELVVAERSKLDRLRTIVFEFADLLSDQVPEPIHFGGFSQGAMVATGLSLIHEPSPQSLSLFSGTFFDRKTWSEKAPLRAGLNFFQSHGRDDPVLPISSARDLFELLVKSGLRGQWHEFRGGHELPLEILLSWFKFLESLPSLST